jgi:hypothetical protein
MKWSHRRTRRWQGRVWFGLLSGLLSPVLACGGVTTGSSSGMSGSSGIPGTSGSVASGSGAGRALVATVVQSLSSNSSEVDVAVYSDASAIRTLGPSRPGGIKSNDPSAKIYDAGSPEVAAFLSDLAEVGDVSAIPIGQCVKSVSLGTVTTVSVDGARSGDLQCLKSPSPAQAALAADCAVLTRSPP